MRNALAYSHQLLKDLITKFPQGIFIDATLGNGHDTAYILSHKIFKGKVYAFDIQKTAIQNASARIESLPRPNGQYQLIHDSHDQMDQYVSEESLHGAIFNLGYLPGGDKSITTEFESTLQAIEAISHRLVKHGQIILVVYSGHPTGMREKELLFDTLSQWPQEKYQVLQYEFINQKNNPPMTLVVEKR